MCWKHSTVCVCVFVLNASSLSECERMNACVCAHARMFVQRHTEYQNAIINYCIFVLSYPPSQDDGIVGKQQNQQRNSINVVCIKYVHSTRSYSMEKTKVPYLFFLFFFFFILYRILCSMCMSKILKFQFWRIYLLVSFTLLLRLSIVLAVSIN